MFLLIESEEMATNKMSKMTLHFICLSTILRFFSKSFVIFLYLFFHVRMEVDQSRLRWFRNLYRIFHFIAIKMKFTALDFLGKLIPSSLGAIAYILSTGDFDEEKKLLADFQQLKKIMDDIKKELEVKKQLAETKKRGKYYLTADEEQMLHELKPPDDYKQISVIPSIEELKSDEKTFLRTNKTSGSYIDSHHYLDVQFRLLREDFVRPLKIGIQDYMKYK